MLAKTPLKDLAILWAEKQDPDRSYDWQLGCRCACAQFADAVGRRREWDAFLRDGGEVYPEWRKLNQIAQGEPTKPRDWTMGGFLTRLRESV